MIPNVQPPMLFGQYLLAQGLINTDQLAIALREQKRSGNLLGQQLCILGFLDSQVLDAALARRAGQAVQELPRGLIDAATLALISESAASQYRVLPLHYNARSQRLLLAVASPNPLPTLDRLRWALPPGCEVETCLVAESSLLAAIDRNYHRAADLDELLAQLVASPAGPAPAQTEANGQTDEAPIARLVDALLDDAAHQGASDIHFEPERAHMRIRYRIDGVLHTRRLVHIEHWPALLVRLKLLAGMDIAEARAAQDGRFSRRCGHRTLDIRAASLPLVSGENPVLRLLDRNKGVQPLNQLGLPATALAQLQTMMRRPSGLLLLTGPTGSGKTSTLYSILAELSTEQVNIMTLEDPVEYQMPGLRQCSLGDAVKLGFADGVRALMRQDPDVLLIGEIRDAASAAMALRAALTGHLVLATLHTSSAIGALPRLLDLGVSAALLAECLIGVVAQRLVRKCCNACRLADQASAERQADPACPVCAGMGYRGRVAIMSLLPLNAARTSALLDPTQYAAALAAAQQQGYATLGSQVKHYVATGLTDHAEALRVTGEEPDHALSI